MSREHESQLNPGTQEQLVLMAYAIQEEIPKDTISNNLRVSPLDGSHDDYFADLRQQILHGFVISRFRSIPNFPEEIGSVKFINELWNFKNKWLDDSAVSYNPDFLDTMRSIDVDEAAKFVAFMHGKALGEALGEMSDGHIGFHCAAKLVYWSTIDKYGRAASIRMAPDSEYAQDADFDLDLAV